MYTELNIPDGWSFGRVLSVDPQGKLPFSVGMKIWTKEHICILGGIYYEVWSTYPEEKLICKFVRIDGAFICGEQQINEENKN